MEKREDKRRVGMVLVMLVTLGQSFQLENESNFIDGKDKITFSSNPADFPTDLQTFLKRFKISYFPKFESFHGKDTNMNKEDSNMNRLPKNYFAPESARQIDVRGQQSPSFKGSLDSQSYMFKVVIIFVIERTSKLGVLGQECIVFMGYGVIVVDFLCFDASEGTAV